ncbi:MAG: UbiA family prenyltransferase, partial [Leadbetterella sp.]
NLSILPILMACGNCYCFYCLQGDTPNYLAIGLLGIAVFVIYTLDGILDNVRSTALNERHKFIDIHQFNLSIICLCLILIGTFGVFFLDKETLILGLIIASLMGVYGLFVFRSKRLFFLKEICLPLIFSLSVVGLPIIAKSSINSSTWILSLVFFILILEHALTKSWIEKERFDTNQNIYYHLSLSKGRRAINVLSSIIIFCVLFFFSNSIEELKMYPIGLLIAAVSTSFMVILSSKISNYFNLILDLLLCLPFILFILF